MMKVALFLVAAIFAPGLLCKPNGNPYSNYGQRQYGDNGWNIQESYQTYSAPRQRQMSNQGDIVTCVGQIPDPESLNPNQGPRICQIPNQGPSIGQIPNQGPSIGQIPNQGPSIGQIPNQGPRIRQIPNPGSPNPNQGPANRQSPNPGPQIPDLGPGNRPSLNQGPQIPDLGPDNRQSPNPGPQNPDLGPGILQNPNLGPRIDLGPGMGQTPVPGPYSPAPGPQGFFPGELCWRPFKFQFNSGNFPASRPWDTDPFEKPFPMGDIVGFGISSSTPTAKPDPFDKPLAIAPIPAFDNTGLPNDYQN